MAIVYKHITKDTNEVFYVGIGKTKKRAYSKNQRSKFWKNIVNKHDYSVVIVESDITWSDACEIEKILINQFGRRDNNTGILVNMTDGGDGNNNQICTDETRAKMSKTRKGRKYTKEHRLAISNGQRSMKHTKERVAKNRLAHLGKKHTEETKKKLSKINKGKIVSEETKEKLSIINSEYNYQKYDKDDNFIQEYKSMYLALKSINKKSPSNCINNNILGYSKTAGGYIWKRIRK
jgi:hypothetical protein